MVGTGDPLVMIRGNGENHTIFEEAVPLFTLMLTEPHISREQLQAIAVPTLVLAGSKDLILEENTRFIAQNIPGAALKNLEGDPLLKTLTGMDRYLWAMERLLKRLVY